MVLPRKMKMDDSELSFARIMWSAGRDTSEIARAVGVQEAAVYRDLWLIRPAQQERAA